MMGRWLLLALFVAVLSPSLLRAQGESRPIKLFKFQAGDSTNAEKMYEDIEIFRHILDRKLHALYPRSNHLQNVGGMMGMQGMGMQGGMMGMQGGMMGMQPNLLVQPPLHTVWRREEIRQSLEGVYLKGQGVVYTATLASLQPSAKAQANEWEKEWKIVRPVSEWESVRRQLRNEKDDPKTADAIKPPALSDVLLKVLAENGHHFSQLAENESLTLVFTMRGANPPAPARQSAQVTRKAAAPPRSEDTNSSVSSKVRDLELLGDLHMKQEHYGQARDAFRNAMGLKPGREKTAALARKLAQAHLLLGNIEEARAALDQALVLMKEVADKKDKPAPRVKPTAELPIKLIISAPKQLLDQVKEGKITFEEFRAKTHVETLRFDENRSRK